MPTLLARLGLLKERDVRARDGFIEAGARIRVVKAGFEPVVEIVES